LCVVYLFNKVHPYTRNRPNTPPRAAAAGRSQHASMLLGNGGGGGGGSTSSFNQNYSTNGGTSGATLPLSIPSSSSAAAGGGGGGGGKTPGSASPVETLSIDLTSGSVRLVQNPPLATAEYTDVLALIGEHSMLPPSSPSEHGRVGRDADGL
jgi:hypothetical protein